MAKLEASAMRSGKEARRKTAARVLAAGLWIAAALATTPAGMAAEAPPSAEAPASSEESAAAEEAPAASFEEPPQTSGATAAPPSEEISSVESLSPAETMAVAFEFSDAEGVIAWRLSEPWRRLDPSKVRRATGQSQAAQMLADGRGGTGKARRLAVATFLREPQAGEEKPKNFGFRVSTLRVERLWVEGKPLRRRDYIAHLADLERLFKERVIQSPSNPSGFLPSESSRSVDSQRFATTFDLWFKGPGGRRERRVEHLVFTRAGVYAFVFEIAPAAVESTRGEIADFLDSIRVAPGMEPARWGTLSLQSPPVVGAAAGALFGLGLVLAESMRRRRAIRQAARPKEKTPEPAGQAPPEPASAPSPADAGPREEEKPQD